MVSISRRLSLQNRLYEGNVWVEMMMFDQVQERGLYGVSRLMKHFLWSPSKELKTGAAMRVEKDPTYLIVGFFSLTLCSCVYIV